MHPYESELSLATAILAGDAAAAETFVDRYYSEVLSFLESKGGSSGREAARDTVQSLMGECCTGDKLKSYSGTGSLEGWLKKVAYNELLVSFKPNPVVPFDEESTIFLEENSEFGGGGNLSQVEVPTSAEGFYRTLMEIVSEAFARLREAHPESLVIIRLKVLHGVKQYRIAAAFGLREPQVAELKKKGFEFLQSEVRFQLKKRFPGSSILPSDIEDFANRADEICHDEELASAIMKRMGVRCS